MRNTKGFYKRNRVLLVSVYHQCIILDESINVEENEKLRATVAYNEVFITEIEEKKRQVEEENRKVEDENKQAKKEKDQAEEEKRQLEEQYLMEKQNTKG